MAPDRQAGRQVVVVVVVEEEEVVVVVCVGGAAGGGGDWRQVAEHPWYHQKPVTGRRATCIIMGAPLVPSTAHTAATVQPCLLKKQRVANKETATKPKQKNHASAQPNAPARRQQQKTRTRCVATTAAVTTTTTITPPRHAPHVDGAPVEVLRAPQRAGDLDLRRASGMGAQVRPTQRRSRTTMVAATRSIISSRRERRRRYRRRRRRRRHRRSSSSSTVGVVVNVVVIGRRYCRRQVTTHARTRTHT